MLRFIFILMIGIISGLTGSIMESSKMFSPIYFYWLGIITMMLVVLGNHYLLERELK